MIFFFKNLLFMIIYCIFVPNINNIYYGKFIKQTFEENYWDYVVY